MAEPVPDVDRTGARVERLLDELAEAGGPAAARYGEQLVQALVELYGAGLARMVELAGPELVARFAADRVVAGLLLLHDLHPQDTGERVRAALAKVRPFLGQQAGQLELLSVDATTVRLRFAGGCPSSAEAVRQAVERAVGELAPEVERVVVETPARPTEPPLLQIQTGAPR